MRAPGEAPGLMALEVAMDEMAENLGMDPVALRILNDTQVDPEDADRPFLDPSLRRRVCAPALSASAGTSGTARCRQP
jgi:xanthine dehydrogenase YagR molybdenum-binding subunit